MECRVCPGQVTRRSFLRFGLAGAGALVGMKPLAALAQDTVARPAAGASKSVILLWMGGGPSQIDTWDPKPGKKTGGPFKAIDTAARGIQISEHLPKTAAQMKHVSLIRSLTTQEAAHERGTYLMHTCYAPIPGQDFCAMGTVVSFEFHRTGFPLPEFVAISPPAIPASPVLGEEFLPFQIGSLREPVPNVRRPGDVHSERQRERNRLLAEQNAEFEARREGREIDKVRTSMKKAEELMSTPLLKAFDLSQEPESLKKEYGGPFGQNCLLARRLVESGVKYVEVGLGGWDTHENNFDAVERNLGAFDPGYATLIRDLDQRGLLQNTIVLCMGEFGRTPEVNPANGRDHWCRCWSVAVAGGGIPGGRVVGETTPDGMDIRNRPVTVPDLFATVYSKLGINPDGFYLVNTRKVPYAYRGKPVKELMA